jgi:Ca-activated chloride channel homolog
MRTSTHRRAAALATTLVLAATVAGCGSGSGSSSDRANGSSSHGANQVQPGPNGATAPLDPSPPGSAEDGAARASALTDPVRDPLSTFALDIDTGSYTRFRDAVNQGAPVNPEQVRTEEFVNYFAQDYQPPSEGLGVSVDAAVLPSQPDRRLVRVGIRSADVRDGARPDADLVLVVDCSGSMREANKMETTKAALRTLVTSLRGTDRVAMICYSTQAEVALPPTPVAERDGVLAAIDELSPRESTNAEAGLALGYDLAARMRTQGRMTRVVLISDGVANVGDTTPGGILERIGQQARAGINLVSVGVGIANYNDHLLEQLADQGDGWHVYVDDEAEAQRVFATGLTGSLVVTGRDAKAQVEFDPAAVAGYRLIGYENRDVADQDFRNDRVDGGEVFAGHASTALYEVRLRRDAPSGPFVQATVRYRDSSGETVERQDRFADAESAPAMGQAPPRLQQDYVVALLTDHLTGGPWSQSVTATQLREQAELLPLVLEGDPDVTQLVDLVHRAVA